MSVDYENISLEKNEQRIIFNSGNPIEDYNEYVKYCKNNNLFVIEGQLLRTLLHIRMITNFYLKVVLGLFWRINND